MSREDLEKLIERENVIHENTWRSFDQYMTAMAAAAVSLSFTYYSSSDETFTCSERWLFALAFIAFNLSLLAIIASQMTSAECSRNKYLALRTHKHGEQDFNESEEKRSNGQTVVSEALLRSSEQRFDMADQLFDQRDKWSDRTSRLNYFAVGTLVLGIILFGGMAMTTIAHGKKNSAAVTISIY